MYTPNPANPDYLRTVLPEVRRLRRLIRDTYRDMRNGKIDHLTGAAFIARTSSTIATLLSVHLRFYPNSEASRKAYADSVAERANRILSNR